MKYEVSTSMKKKTQGKRSNKRDLTLEDAQPSQPFKTPTPQFESAPIRDNPQDDAASTMSSRLRSPTRSNIFAQ